MCLPCGSWKILQVLSKIVGFVDLAAELGLDMTVVVELVDDPDEGVERVFEPADQLFHGLSLSLLTEASMGDYLLEVKRWASSHAGVHSVAPTWH
jgi:hypothetical protein